MNDVQLEKGQKLQKAIREAQDKLTHIQRGLEQFEKNGVNHHAQVSVSFAYGSDCHIKLFSPSDLMFQPGYFPFDIKTIFLMAEIHTMKVLSEMKKEYSEL